MKKYFLSAAGIMAGVALFVTAQPATAGSQCTNTSRPCLTATRHEVRKATQARLYWSYDYSKSVSHFRVQVAKKPSFKKKSRVHTGTYTSSSSLLTKNEGLRSLNRYFIRVRTYYNNGTRSGWSKPRIVRTGVPQLNGVKLTERKKKRITVNWNRKEKVEDAELLYDVRVKTRGRNSRVVTKRTVLGKNPVTIRGMKPGRKYIVQVRAHDEDAYGIGLWSAPKKFKTKK